MSDTNTHPILPPAKHSSNVPLAPLIVSILCSAGIVAAAAFYARQLGLANKPDEASAQSMVKTASTIVTNVVEKVVYVDKPDTISREDITRAISAAIHAASTSQTTSVKTASVQTPELTVFWLNSPMTQKWQFNSNNQTWSMVEDNGLKSLPTIVLGLRSDGFVVWQKIEPVSTINNR